jgi:uncharacterized membrane protein YhdT
MQPRPRTRKTSWLLVLTIVPFVVLLFPQFYNFEQPTLIGIPFFYWFQLLCVILVSLLTAILYRARG